MKMCHSGQCGLCEECCRSTIGIQFPLDYKVVRSSKPLFRASPGNSRLDQEIKWVKQKMKEENEDHQRKMNEIKINSLRAFVNSGRGRAPSSPDKVWSRKSGFAIRGDGKRKEDMDPRQYDRLRKDLDNYWVKLSMKKIIPPKITLKEKKYNAITLPSYANVNIGDEYTLIKGIHGCVCDNKHCFDMYYIAEEIEHTSNYTKVPMYTKNKDHELCILCLL